MVANSRNEPTAAALVVGLASLVAGKQTDTRPYLPPSKPAQDGPAAGLFLRGLSQQTRAAYSFRRCRFRHVCTHEAYIRARRGYEPTHEAAIAAVAKGPWRGQRDGDKRIEPLAPRGD